MLIAALSVDDILRTFCAFLCSGIYRLVAFAYDMFFEIASFKVLSDKEIMGVYQRVTIILTIVMIFYITFEFVKYVVDPDKMVDKEKGAGKILYRIIMVILLIAFVPKIFPMAYNVQNTILKNGTFAKIVLGKKLDNYGLAGRNFSLSILSGFYYYEGDDDGTCGKGRNKVNCKGIVGLNYAALLNEGRLPYMTVGLNEKNEDTTKTTAGDFEEYKIHFDAVWATAAGIFLAWMLILYCIDIAVRAVQLVYLQVIAPIPIISYLSPKKDGMFEKWCKQCLTTYLDIFLRLSLIYFVMLICQTILDSELYQTVEEEPFLVKAALVMGLLLFASKAPKLLEELFPKKSAASGNLGLKAGQRVAPAAARAIGASYGLGRGLVGGAIRRGAWRKARNEANGWATGLKRFTAEGRAQNKEKREQMQKNREELRQQRQNNRKLGRTAGKNANLKGEYNEAYAAWQKKVNDNKHIEQLKNGIKNAKTPEEAKRLGALLKAENDKMRNSAEYKRWEKARNAWVNSAAGKAETKAMQDKSAQRRNELANARNEVTRAQDNLRAAKATGDRARISAAQTELRNAVSKYSAAKPGLVENIRKQGEENRANLFKNTYKADLEESNQNLAKIREQVTEDKNKSFKGIAGSAVSTVAGAVKTGWTGAQATKLEEIGKKVEQGVKNDIASVKAVQKYYDDGGTGFVDRTIQQVEKNIGAPTRYERTMLDIQSYDSKIKSYGSQADLAKSYSSAVDSTENRFRDKAIDSGIAIDSSTTQISTGLKNPDGSDIYATIKDGDTIGSLVRRYDQDVITAHAEQEAATKQLDDFMATNTDKISREINRSDFGTDEDAYNAAVAEQEALKANQAALEERKRKAVERENNAKYAAENVKKNAGRYLLVGALHELMTSTKTDPIAKMNDVKERYDGAGVENAYNTLERMNIMRQNPEMVEEMRKALVKTPQLFEMFMSGKITETDPNKAWKAVDTIANAARTVTNEYERRKSTLSEEQRNIQTSNTTSAAKAAQDYNPGGGK